MTCAKIISMEFKSEEDFKIATKAWREWNPKNLPPAVSRNSVQTGPKSLMFIGIFENEKMMEQSSQVAETWYTMYGDHIYETVVFDGPVLN